MQGVQGCQVQSEDLHSMQGEPSPQATATIQYRKIHRTAPHQSADHSYPIVTTSPRAYIQNLCRAHRDSALIAIKYSLDHITTHWHKFHIIISCRAFSACLRCAGSYLVRRSLNSRCWQRCSGSFRKN